MRFFFAYFGFLAGCGNFLFDGHVVHIPEVVLVAIFSVLPSSLSVISSVSDVLFPALYLYLWLLFYWGLPKIYFRHVIFCFLVSVCRLLVCSLCGCSFWFLLWAYFIISRFFGLFMFFVWSALSFLWLFVLCLFSVSFSRMGVHMVFGLVCCHFYYPLALSVFKMSLFVCGTWWCFSYFIALLIWYFNSDIFPLGLDCGEVVGWRVTSFETSYFNRLIVYLSFWCYSVADFVGCW